MSGTFFATTSRHDDLMHRALRLAMLGRGRVEPNPMVGCVIARDGRILGEGYHRQYGAAHAEREAMAACTESPSEATAYVTLEPCCHTNKKTPPCVPALIQARLRRIVVGCVDPNPAVSGQGIAQLRQAGIDVSTGLLESECRQLNAAFFAQVVNHRPYVTLKWAQSADGKVAGPAGTRVWISSPPSSRVVHMLRARSDAILVGINTVLHDDPLLTARNVEYARPLRRIVLDSKLAIPLASQLVRTAQASPLVVVTSQSAHDQKKLAVGELLACGADVVALPADSTGHIPLTDVLDYLGTLAITHLLVEPGPTLAGLFLRHELADRIWILRSPTMVGDTTAPSAVPVAYPATGETMVGPDSLTEYLNPRSPVYFAPCPSADFQSLLPPAT